MSKPEKKKSFVIELFDLVFKHKLQPEQVLEELAFFTAAMIYEHADDPYEKTHFFLHSLSCESGKLIDSKGVKPTDGRGPR